MSTLQDLSKVLSRKQAILDESAAGVEQQKKSGKQTARERIAMLLDGGSFVEQSMLAQDAGVVAGSGTVDGRPVYVFAQDFAVMDGAMGAKQAKKIVKILEQARKTGTPVVAMCDSNGARVGEGAAALEAYADVFAHMARLSGVVPMISLVLGPCVGAAAMMAKLSDVVIVAKPAGALMMAGPQVLASAMKKDIKADELGGADVAVKTGAAHFACETEADAMAKAKAVLGMLPANNLEDAPFSVEEDMNRQLEGFEAGCDGAELIAALADAGSVLEFGKGHTQAVTALGKMAGRTVAFVYTGKGDTCDNRMKKIARFVRFADCYNIPVVSLVDSTGLKLFDTVERQMAVLSAALAIRRGAHIRMTAFDVYLPKTVIKVLDILADVAVCALGIIMMVVGWNYATTLGGRGFYVSMPWLSRFWMYFPVPLAGVAMIVFEFESLYNHIKSFFVKEEN